MKEGTTCRLFAEVQGLSDRTDRDFGKRLTRPGVARPEGRLRPGSVETVPGGCRGGLEIVWPAPDQDRNDLDSAYE